jgi:microcompartment protein CcmK/EutM
MRIHKVIGSVTLSRCHSGYQSTRLLVTEPQEQATLTGQQPLESELVVVWDNLGAGIGNLIAVSDGAEAAQPFRPDLKAVDAYCSAILDEIHVDPRALKQLNIKS